VEVTGGVTNYPAPPVRRADETRRYGAVPSLGEHTDMVRAEFLPR
jgi:hypothetical protein